MIQQKAAQPRRLLYFATKRQFLQHWRKYGNRWQRRYAWKALRLEYKDTKRIMAEEQNRMPDNYRLSQHRASWAVLFQFENTQRYLSNKNGRMKLFRKPENATAYVRLHAEQNLKFNQVPRRGRRA